MENILSQKLKNNPVIAAVKNIDNLEAAVKSDCEVIFLLSGSISNLENVVETVHKAGKIILVHIDLIEGLGRDAAAIKYIKDVFHPDGIISTKSLLLKTAAKEGLLTVQRFFLLDSISLRQCIKLSAEGNTTAIEIMPGLMPDIIKEVSEKVSQPVIVGGLIRKDEDIEKALSSGALGISASKTDLWKG